MPANAKQMPLVRIAYVTENLTGYIELLFRMLGMSFGCSFRADGRPRLLSK